MDRLDNIPMQPVQSSNIESVGYDALTRVLQVRFKSGAKWIYHGPTEEEYQNFLTAPSPGRYLQNEIISRYGKGDRV